MVTEVSMSLHRGNLSIFVARGHDLYSIASEVDRIERYRVPSATLFVFVVVASPFPNMASRVWESGIDAASQALLSYIILIISIRKSTPPHIRHIIVYYY